MGNNTTGLWSFFSAKIRKCSEPDDVAKDVRDY
jgi:hypothetical protein